MERHSDAKDTFRLDDWISNNFALSLFLGITSAVLLAVTLNRLV